jgi:hypothetical protein
MSQIRWILLSALLLGSLFPFVLGAFFNLLVPDASEQTQAAILLFALSLATFPLGFWAGQALSGSSPLSYILLGLAVGLIVFLPLLAIRVIFFGAEGLSGVVLSWFILYESGVALLFLSGALFASAASLGATAIGLLGAIIGLISSIISASS